MCNQLVDSSGEAAIHQFTWGSTLRCERVELPPGSSLILLVRSTLRILLISAAPHRAISAICSLCKGAAHDSYGQNPLQEGGGGAAVLFPPSRTVAQWTASPSRARRPAFRRLLSRRQRCRRLSMYRMVHAWLAGNRPLAPERALRPDLLRRASPDSGASLRLWTDYVSEERIQAAPTERGSSPCARCGWKSPARPWTGPGFSKLWGRRRSAHSK